VIDQDRVNLTAVAGIDQTRPVHHAKAVPGSQAATCRYQTDKPLRYGNGESGWNHLPLTRLEDDINSSVQVDARIARMGSFRFG